MSSYSRTTFDSAQAELDEEQQYGEEDEGNNNNSNQHASASAAASSGGDGLASKKKKQQLAQQQGPVFSGTLEEERRAYDFMTRHDIPKFVDNICQHLLRTLPNDPLGSVISMLAGQKNGLYHGGAAVSGHNVHGGWIRCFDPDGKLLSAIDHLKGLPCCTHTLLNNSTVDQGLAEERPGGGDGDSSSSPASGSGSALSGPSAIGTTLMACALGERAIYVICSPPEGSSQSLIDVPAQNSNSSSASSFSVVTYFVCKFSTDTGQLLRAMSVPRQPITLHVDRERGYVWVGYRHGGVGILHARGGNNQLGDIHTPIALALHATPSSNGSVWILTPRQIERRQWETGQLLMSIDLPNMLNAWPCSFSVGRQHIYVGAPNPDGTAAFVGMFDSASGEPVRTFVPGGTGCLLCTDQSLGGVWLLQRASGSGPAVACFHSDHSGAKTMTSEVGRAKAIAYQVDQCSSRLWIAKLNLSEDSRLLLIDPFRGEIVQECALPSCLSGSTPSTCCL